MNLIMIIMCAYYTIPHSGPRPPENITVINKTCNSLSVQWSPPSDTGGLAITGYRVNVAKNSFTANTTMTRIDITNLSPGTTYLVTVNTVTITVFESETFLMANIQTESRSKYKDHQYILHFYDNSESTFFTAEISLYLNPFSSTGLNLMIPPPHKDGVNYSCILSPGNKTIVTSIGNITLTDLSPNTTYSVRCLVYENGKDLCYEGIGNGSTFASGEYNNVSYYVDLMCLCLRP